MQTHFNAFHLFRVSGYSASDQLVHYTLSSINSVEPRFRKWELNIERRFRQKYLLLVIDHLLLSEFHSNPSIATTCHNLTPSTAHERAHHVCKILYKCELIHKGIKQCFACSAETVLDESKDKSLKRRHEWERLLIWTLRTFYAP